MAVMSFAHMKNKKATDTPTRSTILPSVVSRDVKKQVGGVLSFAHLKRQKPVQEAQRIELPTEPQRTTFKISAVMPTAKLASVNYCFGCGRFLAATEEDGNTYGKCLREADPESRLESWKKIPMNAKVNRCYFHLRLKN